MREPVTADKVRAFMQALADRLRIETVVRFTGGASAVLEGWRPSTADIDLKIIPDGEAYGVLAKLKEDLRINVELATPSDFIPDLPGSKGRDRHIARLGRVDFYHVDFVAQALSKIERGLDQDLADVREMVRRGLVDPREASRLFDLIEPELQRYPAIDPVTFRTAVERAFPVSPS